jgi:hypothetical protein
MIRRAALALLLGACTPPDRVIPKVPNPPTGPFTMPGTPAPAEPRVFSSGLAIERWLPLVDGYVYQYDYRDGEGAEGSLTMKVQRVDEIHGAWLLAGGGNVFEYRPDGVLTDENHQQSYVLKLPLETGNRWRGAHQSWVEIRRTDAAVAVPAGNFTGCIETLETRGGDVPLTIAALFCPEVGLVQRDIASGKKTERLTLRSYQAAFVLGPEGVRIYKTQ